MFKYLYSDIQTFFWFIKKPNFYYYFLFLLKNKFLRNLDSDYYKKLATEWCNNKSISIENFSSKKNITILTNKNSIFNNKVYFDIENKIKNSSTNFGGRGYVDLIYSLCESFKITNAIETGVAYGWSSEAILQSVHKRSGILASIDMPMIKQSNYQFIGVAVSKFLYKNWYLIKEPDIFGLYKAFKKLRYNYNFVHYDSDKSYYGRKWSYSKLFDNLNSGGIFISDDIQDNEYFKEFVTKKKLDYYILKVENKFVGVIFKK